MADPAIQSMRLREITLPGAHDAAMGTVNHCTDYAFDDITKTQNRSFDELLNSGIRYFDIRPTISQDGVMRVGHVAWIGNNYGTFTARNEGCYGYSLEDLTKSITMFREQNPTELIVIELSHFQNFKAHDDNDSHFDEADFIVLKKILSDGIGRFMIVGQRSLLDETIADLTDAGVLLLMDGESTSPADGFYPISAVRLEGKYENTNSLEEMIKAQTTNLEAKPEGSFFRTFWTLTLQEDDVKNCVIKHFSGGYVPSGCTNILSYAERPRNALGQLPAIAEGIGKRPNVILTDNSGTEVTDIAIQLNKR